jgi:Fe-S-cluster-containing dehydrogenase component
MARYGIIVDLNRCTGCMTCVLACKEENGTGPGI